MSPDRSRHPKELSALAAVRRFPAYAFEIEQIRASDDEFRGLCDDLAAAESALQSVSKFSASIRAERRSECESWIENLTGEIEAALRRKKVIALGTKQFKRNASVGSRRGNS